MRDGSIGVVIFTDSQFAIATAKTERMAERLAQCEQCRLLSIEDLPISAVSKGMDERVRTLHRRLQDEGQTWRKVLAQTRLRRALAQLSSGHFTVEEIAFTQGYTDIANFRRAFKRWTGRTPSSIRNG